MSEISTAPRLVAPDQYAPSTTAVCFAIFILAHILDNHSWITQAENIQAA